MRKSGASNVPAAGEGKRGVDGHLAYLLRQANAAVRWQLERSFGEVGITLPQFVVMTMLRAYPGRSGAELARVALLSPQTVGLITRNLERLGALRKEPHASHGRVLRLALTPRGEDLLNQCRERADTIESRLVDGLDAREQQVIRRWLVAQAGVANPGEADLADSAGS